VFLEHLQVYIFTEYNYISVPLDIILSWTILCNFIHFACKKINLDDTVQSFLMTALMP